jgi:flagellar hook-length control protein FliK
LVAGANADTDPSATLVDPALQIQQAALFMPAVVQAPVQLANEINGMSGTEPGSVASTLLPTESVKSEAGLDVPRQSVAGNAAAFAATVMAEGKTDSQSSRQQQPELVGEVSERTAQGAAQLPHPGMTPLAVAEDKPRQAFDALLALKSTREETNQPAFQSGSLPVPVSMIQPSSTQTAAVQQPVSSIPQAVSHSAWGDMLGDRVVWMVSQQHQGVELHLNPPSLGPLEVRLSMNDGQADLSFSTQHLPVKEAIESAAPRLREMLGESGISLGSVSVNVGSFSQQQQPSEQQAQTGTGRFSWQNTAPSTDTSPVRTIVTRLTGGDGMVDIFA